MKTRRRKTSPALALRIARAQLRAIRKYTEHTVAVQAKPGPPQFIQCWAVGRGYSAVTQALDSSGQVWERYTKGAKDSSGAYVVQESYWVRVPMTRKEEP